VFDDVQYVYSHQFSNEFFGKIEQARAKGPTSTRGIETSLLDETYQAVHAAAAGMKVC
jgi:hypothetical protein